MHLLQRNNQNYFGLVKDKFGRIRNFADGDIPQSAILSERYGLHYFCVDSCCIDKTSSAELTESISSMFQWYRKAEKCYEQSFGTSRWFTRGWTLQELVTPSAVDFFSREGTFMSNKRSLERHISERTGIPNRVLQGSSLSKCTVLERLAWAENRHTARPEDKAYSLLNIFYVYTTVMYSNKKKAAFR
ncbi:HET-domain-containing protein [Xylariaceae sp. FL0016]|nr:HET-domain-containing protein [Xylariaceae sp. FL0016]